MDISCNTITEYNMIDVKINVHKYQHSLCHSSAAHNHPDAFGFVLIFQFPLTFFITCLDHCNVLNICYFRFFICWLKNINLIVIDSILVVTIAVVNLGPVCDHFREPLITHLFDDINLLLVPLFICNKPQNNISIADVVVHIVFFLVTLMTFVSTLF